MISCSGNPLAPPLCPGWIKEIGDIKPVKGTLLVRADKEKIVAYRTGYDKHCRNSVQKSWLQEVSQQ